MTTVQESCMDSPTLPSQPPLKPMRPAMRDRSSSEPCDRSQQVLPLPPTTTTTKETIKIKVKGELPMLPATVFSASDDSQPPSYERVERESRISSFLAPLVIPEFGGLGEDFALIGSSTLAKEKDTPPPVPPKSPKFVRSVSPRTIPTDHPNESSATLVNTSRSTTPNTPQDGKASPQPYEQTKRRTEGTPKRVVSQTKTRANMPKRAPSGYRQRNSTIAPKREMSIVREDVLDDAKSTNSLSHTDLETLSKELQDLEEQCEHLRKTHNSLRASRRTLRSRMITYLKSPRVSAFSRKNILRREEALAELEVSIDEIVHRLEQAETRRTRIRQTLVQHVSAALNQRVATAGCFSGRHTPPHSPDAAQRGLRRKASETDSVDSDYDSAIQTLLSDIERMVSIPQSAR